MRLLDQQIDSLCRQYGHDVVRNVLDQHAKAVLDNWRAYELKHAIDETEHYVNDDVPF